MIDAITGKLIDICPFCGVDAGGVCAGEHKGTSELVVVECRSCGAMGPDAEYPDNQHFESEQGLAARREAIDLWNDRKGA